MKLLKSLETKENLIKALRIVSAVIIVIFVLFDRAEYINQQSKDISAYERAVQEFVAGVNPYKWTVESFNNPDDPGNHGFAYFPGLLYLYAPLYVTSAQTDIPHYVLWKIPVLLADLAVGYLLFRLFRNKSYWMMIVALVAWFFNPYIYFRTGYTFTDPITILFMLLSLMLLGKKDVLSGTFFALSIAMKTFPYILFPVYLLKAKDKRGFLVAGLLVGIFVSLPFLTSWEDFTTYLAGTLGVHSERFVQGRPFLFYISYYLNIELFQVIPFRVYTLLASFSGWVVVAVMYFKNWARDKYVLALIPFLTFYLFTPVFNRSYFMWFMPIFIVALAKIFGNRFRFMYYGVIFLFYVFAGWYLAQWKDGFHIWHP